MKKNEVLLRFIESAMKTAFEEGNYIRLANQGALRMHLKYDINTTINDQPIESKKPIITFLEQLMKYAMENENYSRLLKLADLRTHIKDGINPSIPLNLLTKLNV